AIRRNSLFARRIFTPNVLTQGLTFPVTGARLRAVSRSALLHARPVGRNVRLHGCYGRAERRPLSRRSNSFAYSSGEALCNTPPIIPESGDLNPPPVTSSRCQLPEITRRTRV